MYQLDLFYLLFWLTGASFYLGGGLALLLWVLWQIIEFVCRRLKPMAELLLAGRFFSKHRMAQGLGWGGPTRWPPQFSRLTRRPHRIRLRS